MVPPWFAARKSLFFMGRWTVLGLAPRASTRVFSSPSISSAGCCAPLLSTEPLCATFRCRRSTHLLLVFVCCAGAAPSVRRWHLRPLEQPSCAVHAHPPRGGCRRCCSRASTGSCWREAVRHVRHEEQVRTHFVRTARADAMLARAPPCLLMSAWLSNPAGQKKWPAHPHHWLT